MSAIPAHFNNGPLDGMYKVLDGNSQTFYVPIIDHAKISPLTGEQINEASPDAWIQYGRYDRSFSPAVNGLYEYYWKGITR